MKQDGKTQKKKKKREKQVAPTMMVEEIQNQHQEEERKTWNDVYAQRKMDAEKRYPWVRGPYYGLEGLHQEIKDLYRWLSPTLRERRARQAAA